MVHHSPQRLVERLFHPRVRLLFESGDAGGDACLVIPSAMETVQQVGVVQHVHFGPPAKSHPRWRQPKPQERSRLQLQPLPLAPSPERTCGLSETMQGRERERERVRCSKAV